MAGIPWTTIIAVLGGIAGAGSALTYVLRALSGWRQSGVSERDKLVKSATDLAGELREDVLSVRAENKQLKTENRQLTATIADLEEKIRLLTERFDTETRALKRRIHQLEDRIEELEGDGAPPPTKAA